MSQILNRVRDVDSSNSEAVKETLAAFFQNLLKYKDIDCNRWLRELENVINRFPKYCGTHRPTIELYLSHFLFSNNFYNVIAAAKCAHAIQQVRPAQEKEATAKSCWRDQMIALCDAAHKLIDVLFDKNARIYNNENYKKGHVTVSSSLQGLSEIDSVSGTQDGAVNKTTVLSTRLRNVLVFIQAMLVEIYPIAKPIQPQLILAVILQALSESGSEDSPNVTIIKLEALRTLDALVACLGSNLIPFSALVFRLVMQSLKWSSDKSTEGSSKIRIAGYNSLAKWLDVLHVHCLPVDGHSRPWHDELTAHLITDITPTKQVIQLTMNAQPMKNLSKKARKRLANTMLKESNIASHMPGEKNKHKLSDKVNDDIATAALECVESFFFACGLFMKSATHQQFQELLVREIFAIQDHSSERTMYLLRALEACRKSCSMKVPPPTQYCVLLYSTLLNSPEREVAKLCSQALLDIRLHLHCSPPSLCFSASDHNQKTKEREEGKRRTTDRNRAALQLLLGLDWMGAEDSTVTTIPDEPAPKRTRVEANDVSEVTENISISSDSVHSVEMSSDSDDESIIEGIEIAQEPRDNLIEDDSVIFAPMVDGSSGDANSSTGIHNEAQALATLKELQVTVDAVDTNDQPTQGMKDLVIHDAPTQAILKTNDEIEKEANKVVETSKDDAEVEKIMESPFDSQKDIHEAKTQLLSSDTMDGKSPLSMEIAYDYPSTGNDKVTVLEKMDDENLPSTNDTDDIQITCGQVVKNSQDVDVEKQKDGEIVDTQKDIVETPKVNGVGKAIDNSNGEMAKENEAASLKTTPNDKVVTVEDMLADFVDEVNEETLA